VGAAQVEVGALPGGVGVVKVVCLLWEPEFSFFFALDPKIVLKPEV
jgi:hypothetical protein